MFKALGHRDELSTLKKWSLFSGECDWQGTCVWGKKIHSVGGNCIICTQSSAEWYSLADTPEARVEPTQFSLFHIRSQHKKIQRLPLIFGCLRFFRIFFLQGFCSALNIVNDIVDWFPHNAGVEPIEVKQSNLFPQQQNANLHCKRFVNACKNLCAYSHSHASELKTDVVIVFLTRK